jgi:hypothetical protein
MFFQVPIVRKTLKCVVYKINCLATAHGGGVCKSTSSSVVSPLPSHFYPLLLPYKDFLQLVPSICSSVTLPSSSCLIPLFVLFCCLGFTPCFLLHCIALLLRCRWSPGYGTSFAGEKPLGQMINRSIRIRHCSFP